jgi:hypothetical protein
MLNRGRQLIIGRVKRGFITGELTGDCALLLSFLNFHGRGELGELGAQAGHVTDQFS